ncbi:MAG: MFS transporter [Thermodesulfobacteriota bacterium]
MQTGGKSGKNQDTTSRDKWLTLLAVGMSILMGTIDMSIVNVSLPILVKELNTNFSTVQWVVLGYVLINTSLMLGAARLGDMFNKKRLYLLGLALFTLGSFFCGLADNVYWLIAFRVLQGFGGVFLQALGMALVVEVFPSEERGKALGLIGGIVSIGLASGPALGGIIVGTIGWSWIFWINIPIGTAALFTLGLFVPPMPPHKEGQSFDAVGAISLMLLLACYALAMTKGQNSGFDQSIIYFLFTAAALGAASFLLLERYVKQPMVDFSLFRNILFSMGIFLGFSTFILLGGVMFLLPFFLKYVQNYSTQVVGLLLMIIPIGEGAASLLAGRLADRFGPLGIRLAGNIAIVGSCFLISTIQVDSSVWGYIARVLPFGLGVGAFQATNNTAVMGTIPPERLGIASGLLALSRNLGVTTGLPIVGTVFTASILGITGEQSLDISTVAPKAINTGFGQTFFLAGIFMTLPALLGGWGLWHSRRYSGA